MPVGEEIAFEKDRDERRSGDIWRSSSFNRKGWDYNYAVTSWFRVTADAQFIEPVKSNADDVVFLVLRSQIKF